MANQYYGRMNQYIPRTRAVGEQVREDYDGIERGFDKLPEPNGTSTGFTASFIVEDPTQEKSPVHYKQWKYWPEDVSAGGYRLVSLGPAYHDTDAASLAVVKEHVYTWQGDVSAEDHLLRNLKDPLLDADAVNRRYLRDYIGEHIKPDVPTGGISWSAPRAKGGESTVNPPFQFDLAEVYINGVMQEQTRGAFSIRNNMIQLSNGLEAGDEVQVIVGRMNPAGNQEWLLISDDQDAVSGHRFLLDSTLNGSFTVTLPEGPIDGDTVYFLDVGKLSQAPVTINRNGSLMMGKPNDMTLSTDHISLNLLFCGSEYGWRVIE